MKKVEAWETSDGKLFPISNEELANKHELLLVSKKNLEDTVMDKEEWIKKYIFDNHKDNLRDKITNYNDINFYHNGEWGWNCNGKDNPIIKCIYSPNTYYGDDMCVFCGEPEEIK